MTTVPTIRFDIFIAGDIEQAKQVCRDYCFAIGFCVTVEPVTYIYTGGEEEGVRVGGNQMRPTTRRKAIGTQEICQLSPPIGGPSRRLRLRRRRRDGLR